MFAALGAQRGQRACGPQSWHLGDIEPYADNAAFMGRMISAEGIRIEFLHCMAGSTAPDHTHPYDQWALLLDGRMTIVSGGRRYQMHQGSVLHMPAGTVHSAVYETECDLVEFGVGGEAS